MRTIVHLSDLHFGRVNPDLVQPLLRNVQQIAPDLVVISGDLTQRARAWQFEMARGFLEQLPRPQLVIPGNHDIPLNALERFARPLGKYTRYISNKLAPCYCDDEVAVIGINTARPFARDAGSISRTQVKQLQQFFSETAPKSAIKMVATHHPFDVPDWIAPRYRLRRAVEHMGALARCKPDVFLAGHIHIAHVGVSSARIPGTDHSALLIQAATSLSTRLRKEMNSFNVLRVEADAIRVEKHEWSATEGAYVNALEQYFVRTEQGWQVSGHKNSGLAPFRESA